MSEDRADRVSNRRKKRRRSRNSEDDGEPEDQQETVDDTDGDSGTSETSGTSGEDNSSETSVRDLNHVAMYLDDDHKEKLDIRFEELMGQFRREHGRKLEKNNDFYPAMVRSTYNNTSLEEELELD